MDAEKVLPNWRQHLGMTIKVVSDFKVLGLFALNGLMLYGIGWDTILRPNLESMQGRDQAIAEQKRILDEKESLQKQYNVWQQQLQSLNSKLIPIPEGNSSKVVSVTESSELLDTARGKLRDPLVLPPLAPPHDQRQNVSLEPIGQSVTIDILNPDAGPVDPNASAATPAANGPTSGPDPNNPIRLGGALPGGSSSQPQQPAANTDLKQLGSPKILVERYDYELKVTGTYPALMDVLNELILRNKLLKLNKVSIALPQNPEPQPDAKAYPDYPVNLEMTVALSLFLYPNDASKP